MAKMKHLPIPQATDFANVPSKPQLASDGTVVLESPTEEQISAVAFMSWTQRGCPIGSPEQDWYRAEEELRNSKVLPAIAAHG
jgi:hypothetical protein